MTIGIDYDDTCVNTWEVLKDYYQKYYPMDNVINHEDTSWDKEKLVLEKHIAEINYSVKIMPGLKDFLAYCKENKIKTILITTRGHTLKPMKDYAIKYMARNDLKFDKCIFGVTNKGEVCQKEGISLMIDDSRKNLESVASYGIKTLRFGFKDEGAYALSWAEVLEYVRKENICE